MPDDTDNIFSNAHANLAALRVVADNAERWANEHRKRTGDGAYEAVDRVRAMIKMYDVVLLPPEGA